MEFRQKKFSNTTSFIFEDDKLRYTVKDQGGRNTYHVNYSGISLEQNELEERNQWFRNVGIFWILIGILQLYFILTGGKDFRLPIWLILGVFCFIAYRIATTSYTVIPSDSGMIYIIKDKQHDEILNELYSRRKKQFMSMYGSINPENDPENEIAKFKWLYDQNVIDEIDFESIKKVILAQAGIQPTIN